ncbi:MAG TPA: trypsin-like serine protease, partial [Labilithrix sp.]|nr:trypsin-like serine protease [Labilithrix sp.]
MTAHSAMRARARLKGALGLGAGALLSLGCGVAAPSGGGERADAVRSAIVGGTESTAAEDFVVYLRRIVEDPQKQSNCGGTLVAPNLVLTAKHCVYEFAAGSSSFCDASGEPQLGSTGGYIT